MSLAPVLEGRGRHRLAVAASLALAAGLRLWGIGFSATTPVGRPDEETFINDAFKFFGSAPAQLANGLNILRSGWPEGFFRIVHFLQWAEVTALRWFWKPEVNLACIYAFNPLAVGLLPRLFSALAGTLACALVGLLAGRLAPEALRRPAQLLGTLSLGCCYLAARDSHFGVSDATLVLGITACLYFLVRALQDHPAWLVAAGACAGAALGIKYSAAPLAPLCVLGALGCLVRGHGRRFTVLGLAAASLLAAAAGLELLSPRALTHFGEFWDGFNSQRVRYDPTFSRGFLLDPSAVLPPSWRFHLTLTLPAAFGWPGLALAPLGFLVAWRRDRWGAALLVGSALLFFSEVAAVQTLFVRYASPTLPALAVGLALALTQAWAGARQLARGPVGQGLGVSLCALILASPALRIVALDRLFSRADTREQAADWLLAQGPTATVVPQAPYTQVHALQAAATPACQPVVPPWLFRPVPTLPGNNFDWEAAVRQGPEQWTAISNEGLARYRPGMGLRAQNGGFVTQGRALLACGKPGKLTNVEPLDACFAEVAVFSPGSPACDTSIDLFDSFFVPFDGFEGQLRPGPEIRIYKNRCLVE
jgi:hypothetical protein